jgi:hypothetical protein
MLLEGMLTEQGRDLQLMILEMKTSVTKTEIMDLKMMMIWAASR